MLEDDASSAVYDPGTGYLTVTLTKEVPGQDFKDLDLLAKLLAPRLLKQEQTHPVVEVLDSQETPTSDGAEDLVGLTQELTIDQGEILEGMWRCLMSQPAF